MQRSETNEEYKIVSEIRKLKQRLSREKKITVSKVEEYFLKDALRTAKEGGLKVQLANINRYDGSMEPIRDLQNGGFVMKTLSDPLDIFIKLKEIKDQEDRRQQQIKEKEEAEDQQYESRYAAMQQEIASARRLGNISRLDYMRIATPEEAKEKRYPCQYCSKRFTTESEKKQHSYMHMGISIT